MGAKNAGNSPNNLKKHYVLYLLSLLPVGVGASIWFLLSQPPPLLKTVGKEGKKGSVMVNRVKGLKSLFSGRIGTAMLRQVADALQLKVGT